MQQPLAGVPFATRPSRVLSREEQKGQIVLKIAFYARLFAIFFIDKNAKNKSEAITADS